MQLIKLIECLRRLTLIPVNVCLLCGENRPVRELWYCNNRLYGNILCYECCSLEDGEKIVKYWMNKENAIRISVINMDISLVRYLKKLNLKYFVRRSSGEVDKGWEIKWDDVMDDFLYIFNGKMRIQMTKYENEKFFEKNVDLIELIELNIDFVNVFFECKLFCKNWLIIGDNKERIFFEDVKNWERSFSIFMQNINNDWKKNWIYEEKILV